MSARGAAFALVVLLIAGARVSAAPTHDVYVWQREWTPDVRAALTQSRDIFTGVRVLVAQAGRGGRWFTTSADPAVFVGDPRRRVAVVRYDGAGSPPDAAALASFLHDLLSRWRASGAAFAGVEIDYDCGSARLADYAARLRQIRAALPPDMALSATVLPSWLDSPALDDVSAAIDESVLQVHAVQSPTHGLFDAVVAERWVRAFAPRAHKGFRVALPAYGSRVRFDENGRALAVENEMPVDAAADATARDLRVDPADVVALLASLDADPPPNWRGVAWFRLPIAADRRAWTLAAIGNVVAGRIPTAAFSASAIAREGGASDIVIANTGSAGSSAPIVTVRADACDAADGATGWRPERSVGGWRFVPDQTRWVRGGSRMAVGWVRCDDVAIVTIDETLSLARQR